MGYFVNTQIVKIDPEKPDLLIIKQAADILLRGGLIAFPTETVYGLGANACDSKAVSRIFQAKNRPTSDPLIVHISELNQIVDVAVNIPPITWALAEKFWPGPLTLILERHPNISSQVSTGLNTVAVRFPDHKIPQSLISVSGKPIAAPSANMFTRPSPTTAEHVYYDLNGRVDLILDGGRCAIGLESSVLDLTQAFPVLRRPGGYSLEVLRQVLPDIQYQSVYLEIDESTSPAASPGMLLKHYSPKAKVLLFSGEHLMALKRMVHVAYQLISHNLSVGVLVANEDRRYFDGIDVKQALLGPYNHLEEIGSNLFAGMRALDHQQVDVILVKEFGREGLGLTIWDRLVRASDGLVIDANFTDQLRTNINDEVINLNL